MSELKCFNCSKTLDLETTNKIHRSEECPHCYASIHSCRMCSFYDKSAYNECRETSAERILEKEKANFCDYFTLTTKQNAKEEKNQLLDLAKNAMKLVAKEPSSEDKALRCLDMLIQLESELTVAMKMATSLPIAASRVSRLVLNESSEISGRTQVPT